MPEGNSEPVVKKKPSFIERLKLKTKRSVDTTLSTEDLMPKPRVVYQPQHAASDFSRVTVSPHIPPRGSSTAVKGGSKAARSRRLDPTRESAATARQPKLDEPKPEKRTQEILPRPGHKSARSAEEPSRSYPLPPQSSYSNPEARRRQYAMRDQPERRPVPAEELLIDINPANTASRAGEETALPMKRPLPIQPLAPAPLITRSEPTSARGPPSDFEIFLAQAEANDRAQRRLAWKTLQQRSIGAPIVRPNPHRQYANNAAPLDLGRSRPSSGGGNRLGALERDRGQLAIELIEETRRAQARLKALHENPGAAAPSTEKRMPQVVVSAVEDKVRPVGPSLEDPHSGTLRHQSSFAKKLVEYIKPPREERKLGHSGSKLGMRRSGQSQGD
ncbi:hypothetical protein OQA88_9522 [Cercophora sp. LCS_1]